MSNAVRNVCNIFTKPKRQDRPITKPNLVIDEPIIEPIIESVIKPVIKSVMKPETKSIDKLIDKSIEQSLESKDVSKNIPKKTGRPRKVQNDKIEKDEVKQDKN